MAEGDARPTQAETSPSGNTKAERGPEAMGKTARTLLNKKTDEVFRGSDGNPREPEMNNPREAALRIVQQIAKKDEQPNFNFGDEPGPNDIILSSYEDPDGNFRIKDGRLVGIKGGTVDT